MSKVAAIQMCSTHLVDENLAHAQQYIKEAAQQGAKLVVLPENFALMSTDNLERVKQKEILGEGRIQQAIQTCAKENSVWIVAGTIPIASEDQEHKIYAASLVYDNDGKLVGRYNKTHLFDATISEKERYLESDFMLPGNAPLVIPTPFGNLGIAICFDLRFPELFINMLKNKVEIIAVPAAFTVPTGRAHWELLTRCRAIDTFSYIVAATQGGLHTNGRKTYGHAVIVNPWGEIIAEKQDDQPGIIAAEINLSRILEARTAIPLYSV